MSGLRQTFKKNAVLPLLVMGLSAALMQPVKAAPKKAPELRQITYKYIQKAQEQMAEDDLVSAKTSLEHVLGKVQNRKPDRAAINQMLGVVYANQEDYDKALKYFVAALADDALHLPAAQQVRYNLAQLQMMREQYKEGIANLNIWMDNLEEGVAVPARAWILMANGYSRLSDWKNVIGPAKKAIAASETPPESWYTLLLAAHYELNELPQAITVLETLVKIAPQKKNYWMQLSGMNMSLKRDAAALSALRAAHRHGLYDKESDYTQLANFLTFRQVPYQSGVVYQEGIDKGVVEKSFSNYKRLANFWTHAKETDKAILAYYDALTLNKDADLQLRLGRMLAQSDQFEKLLQLASDPAENMQEKQTGEMIFLSAMAHYNLGNSVKALGLMQKAAQIKTSRGKANSWIGFLKEDLKNR